VSPRPAAASERGTVGRVGHPLDIAAAGVLFDMDGTLIDSTAAVEAVWTSFGEQHGIEPSEVLAFAHGRQPIDTLTRFLPDRSEHERLALARALTDHEVRLTDDITEVAGAAALIGSLVAMRAPVALVTSARRDLAVSRMKAGGVLVPDVLVTSEDVERGKPDPEGYRRAAALLGVPVERCVVFEDAEAGLTAAIASGAHVVVVGGHDSPVTSGLDRIPDFTSVTVELDGDGVRVRAAG
jgi:mannitol-1-/sugar-/sorbitol-6-phosphatase